MGGERSETEGGIHLFLAHPHLGVGGERSETEGGIHLFLAHPHLGVGGERSETEGGGWILGETANVRPLKRSDSSLSAFLQHHQTLQIYFLTKYW